MGHAAIDVGLDAVVGEGGRVGRDAREPRVEGGGARGQGGTGAQLIGPLPSCERHQLVCHQSLRPSQPRERAHEHLRVLRKVWHEPAALAQCVTLEPLPSPQAAIRLGATGGPIMVECGPECAGGVGATRLAGALRESQVSSLAMPNSQHVEAAEGRDTDNEYED